MTTAAEALVAQLESYGVEYVFGLCGHTDIAFLDALGRSDIRFVMARHEQAAAHAADGYARMTGKPGVLLVHVGPGLMNAVTGVATAALDSVPLVTIAGDVPSYFAGRHPHQEVNLHADADQTAIFRPFVKRAWHVHRAEDLPRFTERAFWTATSGRPGAVLVDVPIQHVLGDCDLVVGHGGAGTVLTSLHFGLPLLLVPQLPDHLGHSGRVLATGSGEVLARDEVTPERLRAEVTRLLSDGPEREAAAKLKAEMHGQPAPSELVAELETVARVGI